MRFRTSSRGGVAYETAHSGPGRQLTALAYFGQNDSTDATTKALACRELRSLLLTISLLIAVADSPSASNEHTVWAFLTAAAGEL